MDPVRDRWRAAFGWLAVAVGISGGLVVTTLLATSSQAGILAIEQVRERAEEALASLYADTPETMRGCRHRRKTEGHGGFLFACPASGTRPAHVWFAFASDGQHVELAPVSEDASRFLGSAAPRSPQVTRDVRLLRELREPLATEVATFARSQR